MSKPYPLHLAEMRAWADEHDDMPDGAFFALSEEINGWTIEDWIELAKFEE
jgi:hypothetical protein